MKVDVEGLRVEILLSQPAPPPQYHSSPRQLPAVGTGSDEPGVSRAETQSTEREGFPLQTSVHVSLDVSCTSLDQESAIILLQTDVGANAETITNSEQVPPREEFARPSKKRQQQRMTAWSTEQSKQFDHGG